MAIFQKSMIQSVDRWPCLAVLAMVIGSYATGPASAQERWLKAMRTINPAIEPTFEIDESRVQAAGIRKISGRHIDLYTDAPKSDQVDELAVVFDQSVDQWCQYFNVEPDRARSWKLRAFLIEDDKNPSRFQRAGLMPTDLPEFKAGFQRRHNLWLYLQPGNYYTRHLLIHEGTHGFMLWFLGGYGSPWYGEGMAELFGVHRWSDQVLQLQHRLKSRRESEYWGRVKRIKDERDEGGAMTLSDVLSIPPTAFREVRYYAWSWAGCEFFSNHELSKAAFLKLPPSVGLEAPLFNQKFSQSIGANWDQLARDWELFVGEMEYGYEVQRGRIVPARARGARFGSAKSGFSISAERSWQMTDIKVKQGDRFRVSGSGEFIVAGHQTDQPWNCQSNGITIQYFRGMPLGMLQAGVLQPTAATAKAQVAGLLNPIGVGLNREFTADSDGVLCLRINESPAKMDDNQGALEVTIEKLK